MPAIRPDGWVDDNEFAFLSMIFLAAVIFVDWSMMRSKVGRAILSVKHSEPVAASYGINVTGYKILAFVMSGLFAGIAGSLFAFRREAVVANDFVLVETLTWVLMVVVGGLGNRVGVIVGGAFFALFGFLIEGPLHWVGEHWIPLLAETGSRDIVVIIIGAALAILTIIQFPGGIGEQISPITRWLGGQRFSLHPEGHAHHKTHTSKEVKSGVIGKLGLKRPDAADVAANSEDAAETGVLERVDVSDQAPDVRADDEPVAHVAGSVQDPSIADADPVPEATNGEAPAAPRKRGILSKIARQKNGAPKEEEKTP